MGDIADAVLDGTLCSECGELMEDSFFWAHRCAGCEALDPIPRQQPEPQSSANENTRRQKRRRKRKALLDRLRNAAIAYGQNPTNERVDALLRIARQYADPLSEHNRKDRP